MKKLILALCSIFIATVALADGEITAPREYTIDAGNWTYSEPKGYYKEVKCEICGKLLRQWAETSNITYSDGSIVVWDGGNTISFSITTEPQAPKPLEKADRLNWNAEVIVCDHCRNKYGQQLFDWLATTYNKWLETAVNESIDRARDMQEQAKEYRLQALRKELADFKREMQEKIKQMEVK